MDGWRHSRGCAACHLPHADSVFEYAGLLAAALHAMSFTQIPQVRSLPRLSWFFALGTAAQVDASPSAAPMACPAIAFVLCSAPLHTSIHTYNHASHIAPTIGGCLRAHQTPLLAIPCIDTLSHSSDQPAAPHSISNAPP
jgi:hypothetical protein